MGFLNKENQSLSKRLRVFNEPVDQINFAIDIQGLELYQV